MALILETKIRIWQVFTGYFNPDLDLDFEIQLAYDRAPLWFDPGASQTLAVIGKLGL